MLDWLKIFSSLTEYEMKELSLFCQKKRLSKWDKLFSLWDSANVLYVVESWTLDIFDENNKKLGIVARDDILWEMAILWWEMGRTATVIATSDVSLVAILWLSIEKLAEENHQIFTKIQEIITKRRHDNIDL